MSTSLQEAPVYSGSAPSPGVYSSLHAWLYLIRLSWQRQARMHFMVWISLTVLAVIGFMTAAITFTGGWSSQYLTMRWPYRGLTYNTAFQEIDGAMVVTAPLGSPETAGMQNAIMQAAWTVLKKTDFTNFSAAVFFFFVSILLPLWSLSFATEALGGDRESHSLLWLLTRPLSRPAVYLAKYVALLPWTLALNIGGFAILCAAAGRPGLIALQLYWPAVLCSTLAFASLFHLIGAFFRYPAIVSLVYSFFLEIILGNMPGYLKRVSIGFYTRCMMYDAASNYGVQPESPSVYLPVEGFTAMLVLLCLTAALLCVGMYLFQRKEYVSVE
jgi:ABC-type transport system involved in multi-copper enzyme maturation permease subunit